MRTTFAVVLCAVCLGQAAFAADTAARQEAAPAKTGIQTKQAKQQEKASWDWGNRTQGGKAKAEAARTKSASDQKAAGAK